MKWFVTVASIALLITNLALAVYAVWNPASAETLRPLMAIVGAINALALGLVGAWGWRQSAARERLSWALIAASKRLSSIEVETLFLLQRFKQESRTETPYELKPTFVQNGSFHEVLATLRTRRLIVSLTPLNEGRVARGRLREGDQVDITPIGLTLCDPEIVEALRLKTRDESKWTELRRSVWNTQLVESELDRRATA